MSAAQTISYEEALRIAKEAKDTRLFNVVNNYIELCLSPNKPQWFTPHAFPLTEAQALRVRNLGGKTYKLMLKIGLIQGIDYSGNPFMDDMEKISVRICSALENVGLTSADTCLEALKSGALKEGKHRNLGKKSITALRNYFHLDSPPGRPRCPCCGQVLMAK